MKLAFFRQRKASKSYNISMMPTTRRQVFKDILHLHFARIMYVGLILLAFSLPLHVVDLFEDVYVTGMVTGITDSTPQSEIEAIALGVASLKNTVALLKIPLYLVFAVGLSGVLRVLRQYCWIENVSVRRDFLLGVKQNSKQCVLLALVFAIINFISTYLINTSYVVGEQSYSVLLFLPVAIELLVVLPMVLLVCVCIPVYSNTFMQNIKLATSLMMKKYFKILFSSLLLSLPLVIISELGFYQNLVVRLIYSVLGGFLIIGFFLFIYNILDEQINGKYFPELVGRGITWDEED